MNIELEEVVVQDVSDDALELAAGGGLGGLWAGSNFMQTCGIVTCMAGACIVR